MQLNGRVALVTGAASGLGLATVAACLEAGAGVVAVDLEQADRSRLAALPGALTFAAADVTDPTAVAAAVDLANQHGRLAVAVNCAGIGTAHRTVGRDGPFPLADFERVVRVNLVGTFNVIRLAAAAMAVNDEVDGERGVIVNTASVAAYEGQIGQAAYSASKGGIVGMTLPIARDLAALKIRVCSIAPGIFDTPMLGALPDDVKQSLGGQVPNPSRLGKPSEYAMLVCAIVANPMLNGEVIRLDGAIRMGPR